MRNTQEKIGVKPDGIFGPVTAKAIMIYLKLSPEEASHFLGQSYLESAGFTQKEENLNYSKEALLKVFPKYFTAETASQYERNPKMIASRVYANRMGNGNEESNDGYKYHGRGFIQLTGKNNYGLFCKQEGNLAIVLNPRVVADIYPLESAKFYFDTNNIWRLCNKVDSESILAVSRTVNLGRANHTAMPNHAKEREVYTKKIYSWITA